MSPAPENDAPITAVARVSLARRVKAFAASTALSFMSSASRRRGRPPSLPDSFSTSTLSLAPFRTSLPWRAPRELRSATRPITMGPLPRGAPPEVTQETASSAQRSAAASQTRDIIAPGRNACRCIRPCRGRPARRRSRGADPGLRDRRPARARCPETANRPRGAGRG